MLSVHMEETWFERALIFFGIIALAVLLYTGTAHAAPTVCQIGSGCTEISRGSAKYILGEFGHFLGARIIERHLVVGDERNGGKEIVGRR
jgi:hypothetical protein